MFTLHSSYDDPLSEAVRRDREGIMRGGGYRVEEAWERALRFAVAGLEIPPPSAELAATSQSATTGGASMAVT